MSTYIDHIIEDINQLQAHIVSLEAELQTCKDNYKFLYDTAMKNDHEFGLTMQFAKRIAELEAENYALKSSAIVWHKYSDEKPSQSGEYLVLTINDIQDVDYFFIDAKPNLRWNGYDEWAIAYWAYLPAPPREGE